MITLAEAGKLGAVHADSLGVLSLYLTVPLNPAGLRGLPARADDRLRFPVALAGSGASGTGAGGGRHGLPASVSNPDPWSTS